MNIKSCAGCKFSIKEEYLRFDSALYCYNPNCSHIGGYWTSCSDARHCEYGLCGSDAKYHVEKRKDDG